MTSIILRECVFQWKLWSLPAGFVQEAETVEMAACREVLEETGIECEVIGLIGFRSGVIQHKISDNMAIFYSRKTHKGQVAIPQELEIEEVRWIHPNELADDELASSMLHEMAKYRVEQFVQPVNPPAYTYKLLFSSDDINNVENMYKSIIEPSNEQSYEFVFSYKNIEEAMGIKGQDPKSRKGLNF